MDELENSIIQRIIEVRTSTAGVRGRNKFAKLLGLSPSTYSYYEKDRLAPVPILIKISQIAGIDLNWLLTGRKSGAGDVSGENLKIIEKTQKILLSQPQSANAISAFLTLLEEKSALESRLKPKSSTRNGWIPVLGRTAAGIAGLWSKAIGTDSKLVETQIEQLVSSHLNASVINSITAANDLEVTQFVECSEIHDLFPDSFALQVDGDSMAPQINDGDIVIVSPSVAAVEGMPAVVRINNAIGVTCKLVRMDGSSVHLIPINEKYETKLIASADILWSLAVICHIKFKK